MIIFKKRNPKGRKNGMFRIVRGNNIYNGAEDARSARRMCAHPKNASNNMGLRLIRTEITPLDRVLYYKK